MQTTDRPRFRQDLVAEPIEDGGGRFIDVMDPDNGTLYRFYEVEFSLACAMDGQRDVAGIVKWAEEELGLKPSRKEVKIVISTLGDLGYLEGGAAAAAAPTKTPTPPVGIKRPTEQPAVNRWDAPTAMGDTDDYLERGVVTGQKRPHTPVPDVELGQAGTRTDRRDELPKAPDLELGKPGVRAPAAAAKSGADIPLGPSGAGNVEVDLAADVPVSSAALKEAVRQSQVMKAAEVPPDMAQHLESKPAAKPAKAEPKPEPRPEPRAEARAEAKPV